MTVGFKHVSLVVAGVVVVLALLLGSSAASSAAGPQAGSIRGVVPSRQAVKAAAASSPLGTPPLIYHGGPVMHTNRTYAIYWVPSGYSVSANYKTIIDRYLGDVAAASGSASNVYATDTQYYDTVNGNILNSSSYGGSYLDTQSLPASGCTDLYTSVCVTDAQLQTEIQRVATLNGWTVGPTSMFLMFTANGIGSCFDSSSSACSFTYYCAYHSNIGSGNNEILYSNQPYTMTVPAACDSGQHPNGDDADSVLNVASHEHNEAITDPLGTAWWDSSGYENGDECAWDFGTVLGSTGSGQYNQVINGNKYYLQQEWSNSDNACELTYGAAAPPPTVTSTNPSSSVRGVVNVPITVNGTNFVNGSTVSFSGTYVQVNSTSYVSSTQLTANVTIHGVAAFGARDVIVTNPGGAFGTCTGCFTVTSSIPPPTVTSASPSSSVRGVLNKPITVFGTGFASGAKVSFSGTYVVVNSTAFVSSTQLTASVTIHGVAALGTRDVIVTNPGGASGTCTGCFSVVTSGGGTPPTVTSTSPNTLPRLSIAKTVTVNGTGFVSGATVAFSGTYVQVNSVTFVNASQLALSVTIHGVAATGARNVTVTNPGGGGSGTCTACFTVT